MEELKNQIIILKDIIRYQKFKIKNIKKEKDIFKNLYLQVAASQIDTEKEETNNNLATCIICLQQIANDKYITQCCKNIFHEKCMIKWKCIKDICPICKK